MYVEFVVPGPPVSNQQSTPQGKANLAAWQSTLESAARAAWKVAAPIARVIDVKGIIINFCDGKPPVDVDNRSKPIFDAMEKIVYVNDRQIVQAEITHVQIGAPFKIPGVSNIIVAALQAGNEFVYVRIDVPISPFPLPS